MKRPPNPFTALLIRDHHQPLLDTKQMFDSNVLWGAQVALVVVVGCMGCATLTSDMIPADISALIICTTPALVFLLSPVVVGAMAVLLTTLEVDRGVFEMVLMTNLTERELVWGFFEASLRRTQRLIVIVLSLLAWCVFIILGLALAFVIDFWILAVVLLLLVAFGGLFPFAAALGVGLSLMWRQPLQVISVLLFAVMLPVATVMVLWVPLAVFDSEDQSPAVMLIGSFVIAVAPYGLTAAFLQLGQRFVRYQTI